jgi:iron-sulfur cluster protein
VSNGLFCAKPFKWFEVSRWDEEGDAFLCCPSWLERPIGNLTHQGVEELWNGPVAREIRASILDGSFRYCRRDRCSYLQTITGRVQRTEDVTDPELLAVLRDRETRLPYGPRQINCSYDRSAIFPVRRAERSSWTWPGANGSLASKETSASVQRQIRHRHES